MCQFIILLFFTLFLPVLAYIPVYPTNSTGATTADASTIILQWYSNGSYVQNISFQIAGQGSTGINKGALVHFSEEGVNNATAPTSTPWIALISCDNNSTNASLDTDIFELAHEKGAVSALLYSLYSKACVINPGYSDRLFDIFSSPDPASSHLIEYQFSQTGQHVLSSYDSAQLNASANVITESINAGYPVSSGYLLAALTARNATATSTTSATTQPSMKSGCNPCSTPFPLMVLYVAIASVLVLL
ncbi:hypothetical protein M413DRAFT_442322 [Hebeloma cylindrosporum]|uniref:DOMON domain-containing protein n=1 Tax=Hebeloma cylindrosporum TaxID=76867 RepID=A0A0C3CNM3_HEBCY|nr:hypothetical protein M413DRAFT_442322 [Hebeloma cylindrosporum h7]